MKALSIRQPFAHEIMCGRKTIEVRSRLINYRGDILICASKQKHGGLIIDHLCQEVTPAKDYVKLSEAFGIEYDYGKAICIANLYACTPYKKEHECKALVPHCEGMYAWWLDNVRMIHPFEVKGKLGLFEVEDSLISMI